MVISVQRQRPVQGSAYILQGFIPLLANFDRVTSNKQLQLQLLETSLAFLQLAFQAYHDDAEVRQATKVRSMYHRKSLGPAVSELHSFCLASGHNVLQPHVL